MLPVTREESVSTTRVEVMKRGPVSTKLFHVRSGSSTVPGGRVTFDYGSPGLWTLLWGGEDRRKEGIRENFLSNVRCRSLRCVFNFTRWFDEVVRWFSRDLTVRNGKRTKRYLLFFDAIRLWNCLLDRERLKTLVEIEQRPEFVLKLCFGVKERSRKNFLVSTCLSGSGIVQGELGD